MGLRLIKSTLFLFVDSNSPESAPFPFAGYCDTSGQARGQRPSTESHPETHSETCGTCQCPGASSHPVAVAPGGAETRLSSLVTPAPDLAESAWCARSRVCVCVSREPSCPRPVTRGARLCQGRPAAGAGPWGPKGASSSGAPPPTAPAGILPQPRQERCTFILII